MFFVDVVCLFVLVYLLKDVLYTPESPNAQEGEFEGLLGGLWGAYRHILVAAKETAAELRVSS